MSTTSCPIGPQRDCLHGRLARGSFALKAIVTLFLVGPVFNTVFNRLHAANPLSLKDKFAQRLTEPHSGLVDGQSLRQAIQMVAKVQSQPKRYINTWLDRKVDPDALVSPVELGPTRYASLCGIAESAGCVCYPVDNCILIGRPTWVAELSRQFYLDPDDPSQITRRDQMLIDIQWPMLTTPTEALERARGHFTAATAPVPKQLPHDLWPAVEWRDISPRVAQRLIVGQFADGDDPSRVAYPFGRTYRFPHTNDWRDPLAQIDPNINFNLTGSRTRILGSPEAHQWFCQKVLSVVGKASSQARNLAGDPSGGQTGDSLVRLQANKREFSMKVQNKPAGQVIQVLLTKIGIEYDFAADANQALQSLVSFDAVNQTPWQLIRLIAEQASLKIGVANGKLRISTK